MQSTNLVRVISGMTKKDIFQTIKDKEMDRKDFLKYSGLTLAALVGLNAVFSLLSQGSTRKIISIDSKKDNARGFGSGKYGA